LRAFFSFCQIPHDLKAGTGLIMGLAASGFYSAGKTVVEKDDG
jgi:hypothetical protein